MVLKEIEFDLFQKLVFDNIGISLSNSKLNLVQSRLFSRILHYKIDSFTKYFEIVNQNQAELTYMLNLITTNETYFFREPQQFDFLSSIVQNVKQNQIFRVWSAAASVGAEAYSTAMVLDDILLAHQWEIVGTDINTHVIEKAQKGLYCESWLNKIPIHYKEKYCLKGKGRFEGKFLIDRKLLQNISYKIHNLTILDSSLGEFDIVFLRNVLLYFNTQIKQKVINNVLTNLKVGGYLIISLTENLDGLNIDNLKKVQSSIYQKIK